MSKENKIFILAGGFFLLLGAWWLGDFIWPQVKLFEGGWGTALKCVTGVALIILSTAFIKEYKKKGRNAEKEEPRTKADNPDTRDW